MSYVNVRFLRSPSSFLELFERRNEPEYIKTIGLCQVRLIAFEGSGGEIPDVWVAAVVAEVPDGDALEVLLFGVVEFDADGLVVFEPDLVVCACFIGVPAPFLLCIGVPLAVLRVEILVFSHSGIGDDGGVAVGIALREDFALDSFSVLDSPIPAVVGDTHSDFVFWEAFGEVFVSSGNVEVVFALGEAMHRCDGAGGLGIVGVIVIRHDDELIDQGCQLGEIKEIFA